MSAEGKLGIELHYREKQIRQVRIHSSRPLQLPLLFEGKGVEEVLRILPLLYGICATAQAAASVAACRQALGLRVDSRTITAESLLVWFETAREHLWRVLIDWPEYTGETVTREQLPELSTLLPQARRALFQQADAAFRLQALPQPAPDGVAGLIERLSQTLEKQVFGIPAANWHEIDSLTELEGWMAAGGTTAARYLAQLREGEMARLGESSIESLPAIEEGLMDRRLQQADADLFIAAPSWLERPRETGSLTRQSEHPLVHAMLPEYGRGLLTRLVARLLELASIPVRLRAMSRRLAEEAGAESAARPDAAPGTGLGVVETARGRLVHRVCVRGDIVQRYQILAPTEWNFHPQGLVAQGLLGLTGGDEANVRLQAGQFISAVDPCVGYELEFL